MPKRQHRLAPVLSSADNEGRDDWCTPFEVLEAVRRVGPIMLDPCSNPKSIVGANTSWALPIDGLAGDWRFYSEGGIFFLNPPYGRDSTGQWIGKAAFEANRGAEGVGLVPARTDTAWFHETIIATAPAICFWKGRIEFIGDKGPATAGATFPSILPYWGPRPGVFARAFERYGAIWRQRRGR